MKWLPGGASPALPAAGVSIEVKRTGHRLGSSSTVFVVFFLMDPKQCQKNKTLDYDTRPQRQESCSEHVLLCFIDDSDRAELSDAYLSTLMRYATPRTCGGRSRDGSGRIPSAICKAPTLMGGISWPRSSDETLMEF